MAYSATQQQMIGDKKLLDPLISDLIALSYETKKKYLPIKEAAEACQLTVRGIAARSDNIIDGLYKMSADVIQPFILGCDTKNPKIVQLSLTAIQRIITQSAINEDAAFNIVNALWVLMEAHVEELKLLQTALLLITAKNLVAKHDTLARALALCFRLHFAKDSTTTNTAAATVRQLVSAVFDRVVVEDNQIPNKANKENISTENLKNGSKIAPKTLDSCAGDAYLLFQDLCQLLNADQPFWLVGMTEMTRALCLELIEEILASYHSVFNAHVEFQFLLSEKVCPHVIRLFSPSLKYRTSVARINNNVSQPSIGGIPPPQDKPYFPIVCRLLRIVSVLVQFYYHLLLTECEIFLSLLVKFLDAEKQNWQRIISLEVISRIMLQPQLIKVFCFDYDMKPHSTKIFAEICNALATFIQTQFIPINDGQSYQVTVSPPLATGQSGFSYRSMWLPLIINITATVPHKPILLEMLDKLDCPSIADGYGISLAYFSIFNLIKSIRSIVPSRNEISGIKFDEKDLNLYTELVNNSWSAILSAFLLLLEASTDEVTTDTILKCLETYCSVCGQLELSIAREAVVLAFCKASLPLQYATHVLKPMQGALPLIPRNLNELANAPSEPILGGQVVAVGTALYTSTMPPGTYQGPVMLTSKNILCMKCLLSLAQQHGDILSSSWYSLLLALEHLVWVLGLKPTLGGSLKAALQQPASTDVNSIITTSIISDMPAITAMISKLFESTQMLSDASLIQLIEALCRLSTECAEVGFSNREPSLFAIAKLLETGLVNLKKVNIIWKPIVKHLLELSINQNVTLRLWAVDALASLIKSALVAKHEGNDNKHLEVTFLSPLLDLSAIQHLDVRLKQSECTLLVLQSHGEQLNISCWPIIMQIIYDTTSLQGEGLIRSSFQSLQLIVAEYLMVLPSNCLEKCVDVVASFGLQKQDLNISLTAVGLLWNIADYFSNNRPRIEGMLKEDSATTLKSEHTITSLPDFDNLWLKLYIRLVELCLDERPAVRKSSGQTLFSMIGAHGAKLVSQSWYNMLWKVLFPLLDGVKKFEADALNRKNDSSSVLNSASSSILMHHSRDTAEKQWAETRFMTLEGVARIFTLKKAMLYNLPDFLRAWVLLLEHIESATLSENGEVSLAALKSFQEILQIDSTDDDKIQKELRFTEQTSTENEKLYWSKAWSVWCGIGTACINQSNIKQTYIPSQVFLTALIRIFPPLYQHIRNKLFASSDLKIFFTILRGVMDVPPVQGSFATASYILMSVPDGGLTPLQEAVLASLQALTKDSQIGSGDNPMSSNLLPEFIVKSLTFLDYVVPSSTTPIERDASNKMSTSLVPFAESVMRTIHDLYKSTALNPFIVENFVLEKIVKAYRLPLKMKYTCGQQSTWMLAINNLLSSIEITLPIAKKQEKLFQNMWIEVGMAFEDFLFSPSLHQSTVSLEDLKRDEKIDCKVIKMIRDEILPNSNKLPSDFIKKILHILNQGSIHSIASSNFIDLDPDQMLRENFAGLCFETLLKYSFSNLERRTTPDDSINQLAIESLLSRCDLVLNEFLCDEKLSGKCPLPRTRIIEISYVLQAVSTLMLTLKSAPYVVDSKTWLKIINLYPTLVNCLSLSHGSSSLLRVHETLRDLLIEYKELLQPPKTPLANGN